MAKYFLYRWSLVIDQSNPYKAPECCSAHLFGYRDQEALPVTTSPVISSNGKEVTTKSGSIYVLMDIDPDYLHWINSSGLKFDSENPIKIK